MSKDFSMGFSCHFAVLIPLILLRGQVVACITDLEVVLQLKQYLGKNNLLYKGPYAQWNESDSSPCNWQGITCNKAQRVTGINLSSSRISGTLFSNFSLLAELTRLDLSMNTIGGVVTAASTNGEIRSNFPAICAHLVSLNLSANDFTGEINECFDQCPSLQLLDLSSNNFSGAIWKGFSYLQEFSESENYFTGEILSNNFQNGCKLKFLDLSANYLYGQFPKSIEDCSKLEILSIWGNEFTGQIPPNIGMLSKLQALNLGSNSFNRHIPKELSNCSKLVLLELSKNNFGGEVQAILGNFTTLQYLVLHQNNNTGGIESSGITKLPNVVRLDLSYNNFSGSLPKEIATMPKLNYLILAYDNFSGTIPPEFGNIMTLQALDLSFNQLIGSIPPTIGKLVSLLLLILNNNNLNGQIPPEIGNCRSLLWLNIANNQLSGSIPREISLIGHNPHPTFTKNRRKKSHFHKTTTGACLALNRWLPTYFPPFKSIYYSVNTNEKCRLFYTQILKGYPIIPICLNSSSQVRTMAIPGYIQLSNNQLSGRVPTDIGKLSNVSLVFLGNNRLSGLLPNSIAELPISVLNVSNNLFSGEIPDVLGNVQCLENLDLSCNSFSGELPVSLNGLSELTKFNVSYNPLLFGIVPAYGQLSTFDNDSFIGDPLIKFAEDKFDSAPTSVKGSVGQLAVSLTPVLWSLFTVVYVAATATAFIFFLGRNEEN